MTTKTDLAGRLFVGKFCGHLSPFAGRTVEEVQRKIMQDNYTAHDKWEKAIRKGWSVVPVVEAAEVLSTSSDARVGEFERVTAEQLGIACNITDARAQEAISNLGFLYRRLALAPASPEKDEPVAYWWEGKSLFNDTWQERLTFDKPETGKFRNVNPLYAAPPSLAEAVAALKAARPFVHRVANGETFRGTRDDAQSALAKIDAFEIEGGRS